MHKAGQADEEARNLAYVQGAAHVHLFFQDAYGHGAVLHGLVAAKEEGQQHGGHGPHGGMVGRMQGLLFQLKGLACPALPESRHNEPA